MICSMFNGLWSLFHGCFYSCFSHIFGLLFFAFDANVLHCSSVINTSLVRCEVLAMSSVAHAHPVNNQNIFGFPACLVQTWHLTWCFAIEEQKVEVSYIIATANPRGPMEFSLGGTVTSRSFKLPLL